MGGQHGQAVAQILQESSHLSALQKGPQSAFLQEKSMLFIEREHFHPVPNPLLLPLLSYRKYPFSTPEPEEHFFSEKICLIQNARGRKQAASFV